MGRTRPVDVPIDGTQAEKISAWKSNLMTGCRSLNGRQVDSIMRYGIFSPYYRRTQDKWYKDFYTLSPQSQISCICDGLWFKVPKFTFMKMLHLLKGGHTEQVKARMLAVNQLALTCHLNDMGYHLMDKIIRWSLTWVFRNFRLYTKFIRDWYRGGNGNITKILSSISMRKITSLSEMLGDSKVVEEFIPAQPYRPPRRAPVRASTSHTRRDYSPLRRAPEPMGKEVVPPRVPTLVQPDDRWEVKEPYPTYADEVYLTEPQHIAGGRKVTAKSNFIIPHTEFSCPVELKPDGHIGGTNVQMVLDDPPKPLDSDKPGWDDPDAWLNSLAPDVRAELLKQKVEEPVFDPDDPSTWLVFD
jgi:hypothetical protein